ncbi:MAG: ABC transporter permease [Halothiobacillaceae bacterium]
MMRPVWAYRHFILLAIRNDLFDQFARSRFGALWALLGPLAMVAIYAFVLSNVLAAKLPGVTGVYGYAVYLMAGLLAWNLFNDTVTRVMTVFPGYGAVLKKARIPKIALPVVAAGSAMVNNLFLFLAIMFILVLVGHGWNPALAFVPLMMCAVMLLGVGLGLVLGVLNVFVRDIGQAVPIVLQLWFWLTPIVYPVSIVPERFRHLFELNPVYPLVTMYQDIFLHGAVAVDIRLGLVLLGGLLLLGLGTFMLARAGEEMVDVL